MTYTVYANTENKDTSEVSRHRTLKAAGKSYQSAHTGSLRRVIDADGNDVTAKACEAVNAAQHQRPPPKSDKPAKP